MANDKMKKGSKTVDPVKSKREIQAVKNYLSGKNLSFQETPPFNDAVVNKFRLY